jgi:hypothetical protein
MKSLVSFWSELAIELAGLCGTDASRDIETVSRRSRDEGDAFLRITLPLFDKAFLQALERRQFSSDLISGFRMRGGLPLFLGGFLRNIFASDGALLDVPCVESIRSVRQLCCLYGKIEGECTPQRNLAAIDAYVEADDACARWDLASPASLIQEMSHVANRVLGPLLSSADRKVSLDELNPKHGPGQTADRLLGNQKWDAEYWPAHLESRFPWVEWGTVNYRFADDREDLRASTHVVPARLTLVPKTMSSPRVIVMEPTSLQFMQQALLSTTVESIEKTTSMIGFADQEVNRSMARVGSITRDLVTLDLSEASDRVTYLQAASCFTSAPHLWDAMDACRSSEVDLAMGRGKRSVEKFASMGSAVCFPVEAVVFLTAIFMAIRRYHRRADSGFDLTRSFIKQFEGRVRVYGDDIVVPMEYLPDVSDVFALLGWKINQNKSFSEGNFRESCGGDYWNGHDVTPVRVRNPFPTSIRQTAQVQSVVSLRNQLYQAGYWGVVRSLDRQLTTLFRGYFPIVEETSTALGRHSVSFKPLWLGTDGYQRPLTRAFRVRAVIPKNPCSEVGALLKCLLSPGKDSEHLQRSGRPVDASINLRWVPVA